MADRYQWNYNNMRSEISTFVDDMVAKGWMVRHPNGNSFTDKYWIDQRQLDEEARLKRHPPKDETFTNWTFLTLSPDKNLNKSNDQIDLNDLKNWCERWFAEYNYTEYFYAVEHGSNEEAHYHVHALIKGVKKRLKRDGHFNILKTEWNKKLPKELVSVGSWAQKQSTKKSYDILWQPINSKDLWTLKYNYLKDDLKGSHQNFKDLKISG